MKADCTMRRRIGALTAALGLTFGCYSGSPSRVYPDKPDPHAAERAMELYDANKDGYLDAKELEKVPGLKAALRQIDLNNDGKISAGEISARIESWAASKLGRMALTCTVTHNGKPLGDAKVRFVPEKFLGGEIKTYEGTTDEHGGAPIFVAGTAVRGITPGFYRIEITKSGEPIPAKYNTETQLGQEVANDAARIVGGAILGIDLKY
jgi:hypothetical protein